MPSNSISFESVDPKTLSDIDMKQVFSIEQDMWSRNEGLGEYLKCGSCESVYSKQDIYGSLKKSEYKLTVSELEKKGCIDDAFSCKNCGEDMNHIFSQDEYIGEIRERYAQDALLVLMRDKGELVGFMDGYVSDFDTIYKMELEEHYKTLGTDKIKELVYRSLNGTMPENFFSCSSSGTRENYMNFFHIYRLLKNFFLSFPKDFETVTGISELHSGGTYNKIFENLGAQSIGIREDAGNSIQTSQVYDSDIFVHRNLGKTCKEAFSLDMRTFVERYQERKIVG